MSTRQVTVIYSGSTNLDIDEDGIVDAELVVLDTFSRAVSGDENGTYTWCPESTTGKHVPVA